MGNTKIAFFDIDGTIWNFHNEIPESTGRAIKALRENGHLAFLNTGRSRGFVTSKPLFSLGFDGVVSGCGTMIECAGAEKREDGSYGLKEERGVTGVSYREEDVIFYHRLDNELLQEVLDVIRPMGFKPILEGRDYLYFDIEDFANDPYGQAINRQLGKRRLPIRENAGLWEASKLSCDTAGADTEAGYRYLERNFQNLIHNEKVVESVPHGFSKGSGIRKVCELFGIPLSDTIAFGDSGAGMSPEQLAHLFEPYRTTKAKGTGLGLMVTDRIVRAHGGTIAAESALGAGTTFTIRLPRIEKRIRTLK